MLSGFDSVSRGVLRREFLNSQRTYSCRIKRFAFDHGSRNTYAVENVFRKPYSVLLGQNKINLSTRTNTRGLPAATHSFEQKAWS